MIARDVRQDQAELSFGGPVHARGFDVVDAEFEGVADGFPEVLLIGGGDVFFGDVLPFVDVAHSAAGEDGHGDFGAAKASVDHGAEDSRVRAGDD